MSVTFQELLAAELYGGILSVETEGVDKLLFVGSEQVGSTNTYVWTAVVYEERFSTAAPDSWSTMAVPA